MSGYKFPLETVRRLRAETEKSTASELAKARSAASDADSTRERLAQLAHVSREEMQKAGGDVATARSVAVMLSHIAQHLDAAVERSEDAWSQVQARYDQFVEALKQRQALDKLRDRRKEHWDAAVRRREQTVLDEITNQRHGQRAAEPTSSDDE